MKKLRKIARNEMRNVQGGIAKGMVRCKDPDTCAVRWGWPTGLSSNCNDMDIICGSAPAVDPCETSLCI
ncbi:bacteriocin-like protein [Chryseobacterium jejuense]|uniref:bacteriocin-like protein n=1 Tax=Chryseobacterium jejuense TaxID=445960 RepID=UPI001AE6B507|nr:hypothetical protein [Chryseobacterium jejuense]MBP2615268.1 hypothetical protein [Chryseobacterium jejuense]